jgi:uncharacterized protein YjiS (DUF1127 family)
MHSSILIDPRAVARGQRARHDQIHRVWTGLTEAFTARRALSQRRRSMGFLAQREDSHLLRDIGLERDDLDDLLRQPHPPRASER